MSDRLTAEPGTRDFDLQLLQIATESDHPMDVALAAILTRRLEKDDCGFCDLPGVVTVMCSICGRRATYLLGGDENGP